VLLWPLGFIWSLPFQALGAVFYLALLLSGSVSRTRLRVVHNVPVFEVLTRGRIADWFTLRNWYGHTAGCFYFAWSAPEEYRLNHEGWHVRQQFIFGPFHAVIYAASYLWHLAVTRDTHQAYLLCWPERDARNHE
jgi:hypothetical protein